jgi:two-component system cell cycle sensor histidine kinase/response regulator CckA
VRALARRALSAKGYQVITASDGAEGLRLFQRHARELRLVLLDMTMPEMGGLEVLKRIRATGSAVPVLLSSGYAFDATSVDLGAVGGILEKPYDVDQLTGAVERAIAKKA